MKRLIVKREVLFLLAIYIAGVYFRLLPRLLIDSHLLTLNADIWERLAISQYFLDHGHLSPHSLRYLAYGNVPEWYPPFAPLFFAFLSNISHLDIPTVSSRIVPFLEALTPLSFYFLIRFLYGRPTAYIGTGVLSLTPSFVYWSGISCPQSFTLFMIPVYLLIWISYVRKRGTLSGMSRALILTFLGILLGINFMAHLTFFLAVLIILLVNLALIIEERHGISTYADLLFAVVISQLVTIWWWLPHNLYWWWAKALVTSSGLMSYPQQLREYGVSAGILGMALSLVLILSLCFRRQKKPAGSLLFPFVWAFFPLLEVQNETILKLVNRMDLSWSTLFKPLEGFRFNSFLAQPVSLISAMMISVLIPAAKDKITVKKIKFLCIAVLFLTLALDIHYSYEYYGKIQNAGITKKEYAAAVWFRNNSHTADRIIADYYRVQMFAGVCGGKALLGALFPLRNVAFPYIKAPGEVQNDIYMIYFTKEAAEAARLMERYGCTHVFYSDGIAAGGGFGSKYRNGWGVDMDKKKFEDKQYFQEVYRDGDVAIVKLHRSTARRDKDN
jgi:Dolichyl-phosphate-mannose-protein mannosyltransferase